MVEADSLATGPSAWGSWKAGLVADLVDRTPFLELVRRPELSVVLFRRTGWRWDQYEEWADRLLRDQVGCVVPTLWEGEPVGRLALLHPDTTVAMVEEIIATMA